MDLMDRRRSLFCKESGEYQAEKIRIENGFTLAGAAKTETNRLLNVKGYNVQLKWLILTQSATFVANKMLAVFNNSVFQRRASGASITGQNYTYGSNTYSCVASPGDIYTIFDYNPLNPLIVKTVIAEANITNAEAAINYILASAPEDSRWYLVCKDISTGNINNHDFAFVYVHNGSYTVFSRYSNSSGAVDRVASPSISYEANINTGEKLFYIPIPVSAN